MPVRSFSISDESSTAAAVDTPAKELIDICPLIVFPSHGFLSREVGAIVRASGWTGVGFANDRVQMTRRLLLLAVMCVLYTLIISKVVMLQHLALT